jgi:hypothetical protein
MEQFTQEPADIQYHAMSVIFVLALMLSFLFGAWLRSKFHYETSSNMTGRDLVLVSIIPAAIISALYAKSAVAGFSASPDTIVFDGFLSLGYTAFVGTMSRESLDKIVLKFAPPHAGGKP